MSYKLITARGLSIVNCLASSGEKPALIRLSKLCAIVTAAAAYLLFIAALNSNFPHGPVEKGIAAVIKGAR